MKRLDRPILLLCSERSGSNLIAKIFDAHGAVSAPGAAHLFRIMSECASRYAPGSDQLRKAVLALFEAKVSSWAIDRWTAAERAACLAGCITAPDMSAALYAAEAKATGKRHVLTKENSAYDYLPAILSQSERPRLLFMVRDPRDMAASWVKGPVMRGGVVRATERWVQDQARSLDVLATRPAGMPAAYLRYEDLLANPEDALIRVCADLELDFSPDMLRFSEVSRSAQDDADRSAMWSNLSQPLLRGNMGKFRTELNDDQIAFVEATAAPLLQAFGYTSARPGLSPYGSYSDLATLRAALAAQEPMDKPAYLELPQTERAKFEAWSALVKEMRARPVRDPQSFLGRAN